VVACELEFKSINSLLVRGTHLFQIKATCQ
jgi:hypothetical protein